MTAKAGRKARTAARARHALAWGLVLFLLGQAVVWLRLRAEPSIGEREFGRKLADLRAMLAESPGRPLLLMLGSSRVATGFRPGRLPSGPGQPLAFNFALVGTGPEVSHLVLHRLLAAGIRPTWVFIEYWPPHWRSRRTQAELARQVNVGRLDPAGIRLLAHYLPRPRRIYLDWLTAQAVPAYTDRAALLDRFAPGWFAPRPAPHYHLKNLDRTGWWSPSAPGDPELGSALLEKMRAHYAPILARPQTQATPDRALRALLDRCRDERIRAAVVLLPEGDAFRSWYPPSALAEVDAYLARLEEECGVPVVDARRWVPESEFMDSHHLFPDGAARFTAALGRAALEPMIASQGRAPLLR
jgi:hypothetical protein